MGLKRREFMQRASLALGVLGINEVGWWRLQNYYSEALAQTTGGKLAFLVGINKYLNASLSGCVTDVEMQRELLIHRFGFLPADILTLTNEQATRENIETAFISHLTDQAKPDDLVVFHFSGYGSRVTKMIDHNKQNELSTSNLIFQNTLVPIDGIAANNEGAEINDVLEETLWLLLRSLPTKKVVTILDTSYVYPGKNLQGTLRIRSRPSLTTEQINMKEKAMQMQLRHQQNLLGEQEIYESQLKGLVLKASQQNQFATEADWNGFSSGLFTYALTQNLWSTAPATRLQISFSQAAGEVEQITGVNQQPEFKQAKQQNIAQSTKVPTIIPVAISNQNIFNPLLPSATGVITSVEDNGKTANLWLGGLPVSILDTVTSYSLFKTFPDFDLDLSFELQIQNRNGLKAKASVVIDTNNSQQLLDLNQENINDQTQKPSQNLLPNLQLLTGSLVQEKIRVLPQSLNLMIALDHNMSRIERVDATSGFSAIPKVTVLADTQAADYIFSRVEETTIAQSSSAILPSTSQGHYALFSLGKVLIPKTIGEKGEAVKGAIERLRSPLETLLAAKMLRLTKNEGSTQIKLRANLATVTPNARLILKRETLGVRDGTTIFLTDINEDIDKSEISNSLGTLPIGSRIQYQLYNYGDRPVYFLLVILDSSGRFFVVDPTISNQLENDPQLSLTELIVSPGDSVNIPPVINNSSKNTKSLGWRVIGSEGLEESLIICSHQPFKKTIATLVDGKVFQIRDNQLIKEILNPLAVAQATLQDLQSASKLAIQSLELSTDNYALDINSWATLSFVYRVVKKTI